MDLGPCTNKIWDPLIMYVHLRSVSIIIILLDYAFFGVK